MLQNIPPKFKLYITIVFSIILSVVVISVYSVSKIKTNINRSIERYLDMEVQTIVKMFERERDLKLDIVKTDLKIAHKLFYTKSLKDTGSPFEIEIQNQISGEKHSATINNWIWDGIEIYKDSLFVDEVFTLVGGTSTIFQKADSGYVRISTNVKKRDGSRAVGTYIPNNSPVVKTIEKGETYIGRAFVVNDWYVTAYEPILLNGEIAGMLYVGDKEKDLDELRSKLNELKIGENGFPFVIDDNGEFIIHPYAEGETWESEEIIQKILKLKSGMARYRLQSDNKEKIVVFDYFDDFKLFIAAVAPIKDETGLLVREVIINSIIIGLAIIIAFSVFVYFITIENVRKFLTQLEDSSKKLKTTEKALKQSEQHFQALFNNSSDDIFVIDFNGRFIEVNQVACDNLGYTHNEFMNMHARDIKPDRFKESVETNITMITKFGKHRYESENVTKAGKVIPVEMKSRVIDFKGQKAILTISRDISERKEMEDKILTTIIQTEENERKRFAADLHDDLGPILSTVKLFTDLLKKKNYKKIDENEAIKNIEELVDAAITSTRTISRNIRPNILQDFGLAAAVNDFCAFINKSETVIIDVKTSEYKIEFRGIEESILYQAVKELINNTLKHAGAKNIRVELKSYENQIILYYRDDGAGFDLEEVKKESSGLGLSNIVNKIKSVKGTVEINTRPGEGMFLIASIKLKDKSK